MQNILTWIALTLRNSLSVLRIAKREGNVLPEKATWMNIASIPRPFFEGLLQVELWLWWSLGGEELFFDEFVYLWSVEVYICTDVRNSCYLQKLHLSRKSRTIVCHCRALHVRTFVTEFDRPFFLLSWILDVFSAVHSHKKIH